jgi:hypothetical protein
MKKSQGNEQERSDLELWNLFRSGSEPAFEYIYQTYFDKLYNYGCQFTQDHGLVEDVLQELFLELKQRCRHLSETDNIQPYLYSAFRRKLIRHPPKPYGWSAAPRMAISHVFLPSPTTLGYGQEIHGRLRAVCGAAAGHHGGDGGGEAAGGALIEPALYNYPAFRAIQNAG